MNVNYRVCVVFIMFPDNEVSIGNGYYYYTIIIIFVILLVPYPYSFLAFSFQSSNIQTVITYGAYNFFRISTVPTSLNDKIQNRSI